VRLLAGIFVFVRAKLRHDFEADLARELAAVERVYAQDPDAFVRNSSVARNERRAMIEAPECGGRARPCREYASLGAPSTGA
jgi:hypothetical protein